MTFTTLVLIIFIITTQSVNSVAIFEQCAGLDLNPRFQSCDSGLVCYARSPYYANCRRPNTCPKSWACTVVDSASTVIPPPRLIPANERCDNESYSVCTSGTTCVQRTATESECRTQCQTGWACDTGVAQEFEQCGGEGYIGVTRCAPGLRCFVRNKWYSHCATRCPEGDWSCSSSSS